MSTETRANVRVIRAVMLFCLAVSLAVILGRKR